MSDEGFTPDEETAIEVLLRQQAWVWRGNPPKRSFIEAMMALEQRGLAERVTPEREHAYSRLTAKGLGEAMRRARERGWKAPGQTIGEQKATPG